MPSLKSSSSGDVLISPRRNITSSWDTKEKKASKKVKVVALQRKAKVSCGQAFRRRKANGGKSSSSSEQYRDALSDWKPLSITRRNTHSRSSSSSSSHRNATTLPGVSTIGTQTSISRQGRASSDSSKSSHSKSRAVGQLTDGIQSIISGNDRTPFYRSSTNSTSVIHSRSSKLSTAISEDSPYHPYGTSSSSISIAAPVFDKFAKKTTTSSSDQHQNGSPSNMAIHHPKRHNQNQVVSYSHSSHTRSRSSQKKQVCRRSRSRSSSDSKLPQRSFLTMKVSSSRSIDRRPRWATPQWSHESNTSTHSSSTSLYMRSKAPYKTSAYSRCSSRRERDYHHAPLTGMKTAPSSSHSGTSSLSPRKNWALNASLSSSDSLQVVSSPHSNSRFDIKSKPIPFSSDLSGQQPKPSSYSYGSQSVVPWRMEARQTSAEPYIPERLRSSTPAVKDHLRSSGSFKLTRQRSQAAWRRSFDSSDSSEWNRRVREAHVNGVLNDLRSQPSLPVLKKTTSVPYMTSGFSQERKIVTVSDSGFAESVESAYTHLNHYSAMTPRILLRGDPGRLVPKRSIHSPGEGQRCGQGSWLGGPIIEVRGGRHRREDESPAWVFVDPNRFWE